MRSAKKPDQYKLCASGKPRTQTERSAVTRARLVEAAIKCLCERGFGETSTAQVCQRAGVSRGAMLHQFPTKAELLAHVVEAVFEEEVTAYGHLLSEKTDPCERLVAYPAAAFEVIARPSGVAVLEILQGSRSDDVLAAMLKPVLMRNDAAALLNLERELYRKPSVPMVQLVVGLARGLVISRMMAKDHEDDRDAIILFEQLIKASLEAGVIPPPSPTG